MRSLSIVAAFDAEPVVRPLRSTATLLGLDAVVDYRRLDLLRSVAPAAADVDVVVVLVRAEELRDAYPSLDLSGLASALRPAITTLAGRSELVLCLCPSTPTGDDAWLRDAFSDVVGADRIVDAGAAARGYAVDDWFLPPVEGIAPLYTSEFLAALAAAVLRWVDRLFRPPVKAVITDLDWTLWNGSCAEDGPESVTIGPGRGEYLRSLRWLAGNGVALGIASRNELTEVHQAFDRLSQASPEMLRIEDFVEVRAGWRPKPVLIQEILDALGYAPATIVYLDDNPAECQAVRETLPEIMTFRFPAEDADVPAFLSNAWMLDLGTATAADRGRAEEFSRAKKRAMAIGRSATGSSAAKSLELKINIADANEGDGDRIRQLADRTTQFNFTSEGLSFGSLADFSADRETEVMTVRAEDRFGDYGLVGAFFLRYGGSAVIIERFMLSCRVLNRGVEDRVFAEIRRRAGLRDRTKIIVRFTPTARNGPAGEFLARVERASHSHGVPVAVVDQAGRSVDPASPAAVADGLASRPVNRRTTFLAELAESLHDATSLHARILRRPGDGHRNRAQSDVLWRTITHVWESLLGIPGIGATEDLFTELGATSLEAFAAKERLSKLTGRSLSLADLLGLSTVQAQHRHLSGSVSSSPMTLIRKGSTTPVVFLPPAGGFAHEYLRLISRLAIDNPVYICQAPEYTRQYHRLLGLDELQTAYRDLILAAGWPNVLIAGWSFGAVLALEVAVRLGDRGVDVTKLLLFDPPQPADTVPRPEGPRADPFERFFELLDPWDCSAAHAKEISRDIFGDAPAEAEDPWSTLVQQMTRDADPGNRRLPIKHLKPRDVVFSARVWKKNHLMLGDYRPCGTYGGNATIFSVPGGEQVGGVLSGALVGRVVANEYPVTAVGARCPHLAMMHPENTVLFEDAVTREIRSASAMHSLR